MSGKLTKRQSEIEKRLTLIEHRLMKLDQALAEFWSGIPYEMRMELIKEIGGTEEEE